MGRWGRRSHRSGELATAHLAPQLTFQNEIRNLLLPMQGNGRFPLVAVHSHRRLAPLAHKHAAAGRGFSADLIVCVCVCVCGGAICCVMCVVWCGVWSSVCCVVCGVVECLLCVGVCVVWLSVWCALM